MHYIASLSVPHFYILPYAGDAERMRDPLLIAREKKIIDANPAALQSALRVGMSAQEAKCMVENSSWIIPFENERYVELQTLFLEAAAEFSSKIEIVEVNRICMDISSQTMPWEIAWLAAKQIQKSLATEVHVGLSSSKWTSTLSETLWRDDLPKDFLNSPSCNDLPAFLAPYRTGKLTPVSQEAKTRLNFLGYRQIGDVQRLPIRILRQQFPEEFDLIHAASLGTHHDPVVPNYVPQKLSSSISLNDCSYWAEIEPGLHRIAKQLSYRLKQSDSISRVVSLTVEFSSFRETKSERKFPKPLQTARDLVRCIAIMMPECKEPIKAIRVELPQIERLRQKQRQLDGSSELSERKISAESAFRAVKTVFGDSAIKVASEVEIPRRKRVLQAWQNANGWH